MPTIRRQLSTINGLSPRYLRLLYPLLQPLRSVYVSSEQIGCAMLQAIADSMRARIIENREIRDLASHYLSATRQR